jgi:hypothetical protein
MVKRPKEEQAAAIEDEEEKHDESVEGSAPRQGGNSNSARVRVRGAHGWKMISTISIIHLRTMQARRQDYGYKRGYPYPTLNPTGSQPLIHTLPKSHGCGFGEWVRISNDRFMKNLRSMFLCSPPV